MSWFRYLVENGHPEDRDGIHCMFISQHHCARKDYRDLPSITADTGKNEEDVEAFCKVQAERLVPKFQVEEDYTHEIAQRVSAADAGMSALNNMLALLTIEKTSRSLPICSSCLDQYPQPELARKPGP